MDLSGKGSSYAVKGSEDLISGKLMYIQYLIYNDENLKLTQCHNATVFQLKQTRWIC